MHSIKISVAILILSLITSFSLFKSVDWTVKDDYIIKFRFGRYTFGVDSMPAPNYGTIKGLKAAITFDENDLKSSKIKASIDARTIDTGDPSKNSSATGPDVLMADRFPQLTFESTSLRKTLNGYEATGLLTIKDISKQITFPFTFVNSRFDGGFTIDTRDFKFTHPHVPKAVSVFFTIPVGT